jgi:hypothetical protein
MPATARRRSASPRTLHPLTTTKQTPCSNIDEEWDRTPKKLQVALLLECAERE